MSRSFYLGNEEQLFTGSNLFSSKISATPTDYALTAAQAAAYAALNTVWAEAYTACKDKQTRTPAKIQSKRDAKIPLKDMAAVLARIINASETVTNEQRVDLGISVREAPKPVGDPGTPYALKVGLNADGTLQLGWKCDNPPRSQGTLYQIWRQVDGGEERYLGGTGAKDFTDRTVPEGATEVVYQIQAVRSNAVGAWARFSVKIGVLTTPVVTTMQPRMAA